MWGVLDAKLCARKTGNLTADELTPPIAVPVPPDGPRTGLLMGVLVPLVGVNGMTALTLEVKESDDGSSWRSCTPQAIRALTAAEISAAKAVLVAIPFYHSANFVGLASDITGTITGAGAGVIVAYVLQNRSGAGKQFV